MKPFVYGIIRVISDLAFIATLIVTNTILQNIEPYKQGYFPQDESIKKPFKSNTISSTINYVVSSLLILFTIVVGEMIVGSKSLRRTHHRIPVILYPIYDSLIVAFFGYFATIGLTDVGKVAFGRLRPNFIDACKPSNYTTTNLGFISDITCSADKSTGLRKSFPSGHTSIAIYSAIFLCLYIQLRFSRYRIYPGIRTCFQVTYIALGLTVGYSRILDNKHHWSDVLGGGLLGFLLALSTLYYLPYCGDTTDSLPTCRDDEVISIEYIPLNIHSSYGSSIGKYQHKTFEWNSIDLRVRPSVRQINHHNRL
ncbi:hypothetical protein MN116_000635 [Schistosoma mekongi]|uniref:Phosphatidic acid phosphatase type 2/haloperoxidase domain-containing protein n=1 Tax=Schistosoma mekongi TaxID=38744 RepID=A0AAE2D8P8_SCHME|nr:hypothetical protein MN116_000635 [Schistosoma mekongi]